MSILSLHPDVFQEIFERLPTQRDRQQATLQLTRAVPRAPIPLQHLFEVVRLDDASQAENLYRRIQSDGLGEKDGGKIENGMDEGVVGDSSTEGIGCAGLIRSLHIDTSDADPNIVLKILELTRNVEHLYLSVSPKFLPGHLQAALKRPKMKLKSLEIRFCRCMIEENATPAKDSFYDSALSELAHWPSPPLSVNGGCVGLHTLSLIQGSIRPSQISADADDDELKDLWRMAMTGYIVNPFVSSSSPLTELLTSPVMSSLQSLTMRIPRGVSTDGLFGQASAFPSVFCTSWSCASRNIRYLDLSSTSIQLSELEKLLRYLSRLEHLVLDDTSVILPGFPLAVEESWRKMGSICASAGLSGAAALEVHLKTGSRSSEGLASVRDQDRELQVSSGDTGDEVAAMHPISPATVASSSEEKKAPQHLLSKLALSVKQKIRFVPFPPTLRSLRIPMPRYNLRRGSRFGIYESEVGFLAGKREEEEKKEIARRVFKAGWERGLEELRAGWKLSHTKILKWSSSPSKVVVMFKNKPFDEGEGEVTFKEEEIVPATLEMLEALLLREFPCPDLLFSKDEFNAS